jgi:hypothetical protein
MVISLNNQKCNLNSTFQYFFSKYKNKKFEQFSNLKNGYILSFNKKTEVFSSEVGNTLITIVGLCIDSHSEYTRDQIPSYLLKSTKCIDTLLSFAERLAGKYILIYQDGDSTCVVGDATCSLPVFYYKNSDGLHFSATEYLLACSMGLNKSEDSLDIYNKLGLNQAMPYDKTLYKGLYSLIPNHYMSASLSRAKRFYPNPSKFSNIKSDVCIFERSNKLISNIVSEYGKSYDLVCPLTSGWDSRVVFSFLSKHRKTDCYTFNHKHFSERSQEISIPKIICTNEGVLHQTLAVKPIPETIESELREYAGIGWSSSTLNLAYTVKDYAGERAIINGDIIGQIGKSSLFNAVPYVLSNKMFFLSKTHSYSNKSWDETSFHVDQIRKSADESQVFDLFAWEQRCGRWAGQSSEVYSVLGVNMLNIFNCSEVIRLWIQLDRTKRVNSTLHKKLLEMNNTDLLVIPINPDDRSRWIRKWPIIFYFASHLKFYSEIIRFNLKNIFRIKK